MAQRELLGMWRKWYSDRTGIAENAIMINGRHGKACKEIITHFKAAYPDHTPEECLEAILKNWDRLDPWFRSKPQFMELWAIRDHLNNIITTIKNGNGDSKDQISEYLRSL